MAHLTNYQRIVSVFKTISGLDEQETEARLLEVCLNRDLLVLDEAELGPGDDQEDQEHRHQGEQNKTGFRPVSRLRQGTIHKLRHANLTQNGGL